MKPRTLAARAALVFSLVAATCFPVAAAELGDPGSAGASAADGSSPGGADADGSALTDGGAADADPAPRAPTSALPKTRKVRLLLQGGFKGRFGVPDCRAEDPLSEAPAVTRLAALTAQLRAEAEAENATTLVLHTGDLLFPGALSSYLLDHGAAGHAELLSLVAPFRYDAVGLGGLDLSMPPARLDPFFKALSDADLPLLASNLACTDVAASPALCSVVRPGGQGFRIIERDGLRVAVMAVLDPAHAEEMPPANLVGVSLESARDAVEAGLAGIEAQGGADLVVLMAHPSTHSAARRMEKTLVGLAGVDVVVSKMPGDSPWKSQDHGDVVPSGWKVLPGSGTVIIDGGRKDDRLVQVDLELDAVGERAIRVREALIKRSTETEPEPILAAALDDLSDRFCADWGKPVAPDVSLSQAMDKPSFIRWSMDVLRREAHAEVAAVNSGSLRNLDLLPLTGSISRADLHSLLPFGGQLVVGWLSGSDLEMLAMGLGSDLLASGITDVDGAIRANGRAIDPDRPYRVVLNRFVADGGDGLLMPGSLKRRKPFPGGKTTDAADLVQVLADSLKARRFVGRKTGSLDPTRKHLDLHPRPVWSFAASVDASYTKTKVKNPPEDPSDPYSWGKYSQSQLAFGSSDELSVWGVFRSAGDSRDHHSEFNLTLSYTTARIEDFVDEDAEGNGFVELDDQILGRATYEFAGLRGQLGDKWYLPAPFVEGQMDTEFTRPAENTSTRDWHRLRLLGIAGVRLRPLPTFTIQVGASVRHEVLEPDSVVAPGVAVGYRLSRTSLVRVLKRPLQLASETQWLFNRVAVDDDSHEIRHRTSLYYSLLDMLYLSTTFNLFATRQDSLQEWGTNVSFLVGINVDLRTSFQAW